MLTLLHPDLSKNPWLCRRRQHQLDARRCISYWTIEQRETIPLELREAFGDWWFGCDICQDVCPWNQRFAQPTDVPDLQPYPANIAPTLKELAQLTPEDYEARFPASALRRIKLPMLRRNAAATLAQVTPPPKAEPDPHLDDDCAKPC